MKKKQILKNSQSQQKRRMVVVQMHDNVSALYLLLSSFFTPTVLAPMSFCFLLTACSFLFFLSFSFPLTLANSDDDKGIKRGKRNKQAASRQRRERATNEGPVPLYDNCKYNCCCSYSRCCYYLLFTNYFIHFILFVCVSSLFSFSLSWYTLCNYQY